MSLKTQKQKKNYKKKCSVSYSLMIAESSKQINELIALFNIVLLILKVSINYDFFIF